MVRPEDIRKARILVVDDSRVNILLLEQILAGDGYTCVSSTTDSGAVCDLYRENHYDLILLDLQMPSIDGFQVMEGLKKVETEGYLPVLVVTAQPSHKLRALQAGAKDFIAKPFDQAEVLTRVFNMIQVRLLLREAKSYGTLLEHYDRLTGLPNRALYLDLLSRALDRPGAQDGNVSVLTVAIDRFKSVNDAFGRELGGALLRRVAIKLGECVGPMDVVARFERDEFGIIVATAAGNADRATAVANKIREALRAPIALHGRDIAVTASVGIAVSSIDSQDPDTLLKYADSALHAAKEAGGDTHRFCSTDVNARALQALETELALRGALDRNEFVLHYQPKMAIHTGEWSGVEALLRWNRPGHGLLHPSAFISVLEESGLIIPVGSWVIESACRQIAEWESSGLGSIRVAVNVSAKQFLRAGFVQQTAQAIRESGIAPDLLNIEITESSLMSRTEATDKILLELKALGVWIAIDDFGTGYSSLSYLRRFPIDTLKIDSSFVRDVIASTDGAAIVVAIINMARSLNLKVVAEGVETGEQFAFLKDNLCDEVQGYFCSRPLPLAELESLRQQGMAAIRS